ncbi:MAG: penicillin-binding protein 1C [Flavobacteriales bacterium]|jgi:penicillin-binding protein 1C
MKFAIHRKKKVLIVKFGRGAFELFALCLFALYIFNFIRPLEVKVDYSTLVTDKNDKVLHAFLNNDDKWRMYIEPDEISDLLKEAFLEKEDKYFYYHPGVNPFAILRAVFNNIVTGRRTSGASTITMQVARLLNPKARTYQNKFIEIVQAFQLEMKYSKDEILNLYLNLVPYGGNIEGVKAMSVLCLDKLPLQLSLSECVALSIIPNTPNSLLAGKHNERINRAKNEWVTRHLENEAFPLEQLKDALKEDFIGERKDAPKEAPHLSLRLSRANRDRANLKATIDINTQKKVEKLVSDYSRSLSYRGIHNSSVMIIDNQTGNVLAYVGSSDFNDKEHAGQVDGISAIRSPGSTLKPFLYGLAMDVGLITPNSKLLDVPINFQGYEPENYDGEFHGSVTAKHALAHSLNIPAVKLLDGYSTKAFVKDLHNAGFAQISADKNKLGLSLILGGCGVSLEDLCGLYAAFSREGKGVNIKYLDGAVDEAVADTLLSPSASSLLSDMLLDVSRPDLPSSWRNTLNLPAVAWKTGTSYGRKDAWSIGYNKEITIGVWVGNFDGTGVPEMSGSTSAAPLLFQLFNTMNVSKSKNWINRAPDLDYRQVCSVTGQVPNEKCDNLIIDDFIPGISNTLKCDHIKRVWINPDSSMSYCMTCRPDVGYIEAYFDNLPNALVAWYDHRHVNYEKIPAHNPKCERVFYENEPRIISPVAGISYYVDIVDSTEMVLACQAYNDVDKVYWYLNDKFLQEAEPNEQVFFFPKSGDLSVTCVDDKGRKTRILTNIQYSNF